MQQCWQAVLHLLQYLNSMIDYGITFDDSKGYRLVVYSNTDWAADTKDRKLIIESLIKIAEAPVHWRSIKQTGILLSTTKAKYIAASETAKNMVITHGILHKLGIIP